MAKQGIFYNSNAAKVFRKADRIICRTADDGLIYLSDGTCIYLVNVYDYDKVFRSTIQCDPGNWLIDSSGKRELLEDELDLPKMAKSFIDSFEMANGTICKVFPGLIQSIGSDGRQRDYRGIYNPHRNTVAFCQAKYLDGIVLESCEVHNTGIKNVIGITSNNNVVAFILPALLFKDGYTKAVQAFFAED